MEQLLSVESWISRVVFRELINLCPNISIVRMMGYDVVRIFTDAYTLRHIGIDFRDRRVILDAVLDTDVSKLKETLMGAVNKIIDGDCWVGNNVDGKIEVAVKVEME